MKKGHFLSTPQSHVRSQRTCSGFEPLDTAGSVLRDFARAAALLLAVAAVAAIVLVVST